MRPLSSQKRTKTVARTQATGDLGDPVRRARSRRWRRCGSAASRLRHSRRRVSSNSGTSALRCEVFFQQAQLGLQVASSAVRSIMTPLLSADGRERGRHNELLGVAGDDADGQPVEPGREACGSSIGHSSHRPVRGSPRVLARRATSRASSSSPPVYRASGVASCRKTIPRRPRGSASSSRPQASSTGVREADPGGWGRRPASRRRGRSPSGAALLLDDRMERRDELRRDVDRRSRRQAAAIASSDPSRCVHPRLEATKPPRCLASLSRCHTFSGRGAVPRCGSGTRPSS